MLVKLENQLDLLFHKTIHTDLTENQSVHPGSNDLGCLDDSKLDWLLIFRKATMKSYGRASANISSLAKDTWICEYKGLMHSLILQLKQ